MSRDANSLQGTKYSFISQFSTTVDFHVHLQLEMIAMLIHSLGLCKDKIAYIECYTQPRCLLSTEGHSPLAT